MQFFQAYLPIIKVASHNAATFGSQINGKITVLSHFQLVANFGLRKHSVVSGDHCHLCSAVFRKHLVVIVAGWPKAEPMSGKSRGFAGEVAKTRLRRMLEPH